MTQNVPKKINIDDVAKESKEQLAMFKAVFPFDFFPDKVVIDSQSITIVHNFFFGVKQKVMSHFDDLAHSELNVGPLFGSIKIFSKYFVDGEEQINWLTRRDASDLHAIIQGILISRKENVDLKSVPKEELIYKLHEIGNNH